MKYIRLLRDLSLADVALVGGKNASLGQLLQDLGQQGVRVPQGFAITADAYWALVEHNHLDDPIKQALADLSGNYSQETLARVGRMIRQLFETAAFPDLLVEEITHAYKELQDFYHDQNLAVAVRSSATAEDMPNASFAGQQESFLHVVGNDELLKACHGCFASLFTDRSLSYREQKGLSHIKIALSIGVQKMVRSDIGSAGIAFSLDTESGAETVVTIEGSYGLGEMIVQGLVVPDFYIVHKKMLNQGYHGIIYKKCGDKAFKLADAKKGTVREAVSPEDRRRYVLNDEQIIELARNVIAIEKRYSEVYGKDTSMDVEWAVDGFDGKLYVVQARPETVHTKNRPSSACQYIFHENESRLQKQILVKGQSVGTGVARGKVKIVASYSDDIMINAGDILVTQMTNPDWVSVMKQAAGIITNQGGRTCHAAIVSRELGIPALVGATQATDLLQDGQEITLDCSKGLAGYVYQGYQEYEIKKISLNGYVPPASPAILLNIADPDRAFHDAILPVVGVGLARMEFILSNEIAVHPMALLYPEKILDQKIRDRIAELVAGYASPSDYFITRLSYGIARIAGAFYPRQVLVRFSDFKTNEYRQLLGGNYFEPIEENPMLGLRGASRYDHPLYRDAFALECQAVIRVRESMGLKNLEIMVPFVRTVDQAERVVATIARHGLLRGKDGLRLFMMCETPANILLLDQFAEFFDGFSLGSNDLTQLVVGVDRDAAGLAALFDERNPAVMMMIDQAIKKSRALNKPIGICGQAPSDYPEMADHLSAAGITSLSLSYDAVVAYIARHITVEKEH